MKRGVTDFGWRAGFESGALRPMSSTRRASPCPVNIGVEQQRLRKLEAAAPAKNGPHAMVRLIARVIGIGIETTDMLVNEIVSRHLRDSKAVARYAGLTGSPDESGRRREKGLARTGNARVRRGMIQLAWGARAHQGKIE
jgi:transposase